MSFAHQDWNPVILNQKKDVMVETVVKSIAGGRVGSAVSAATGKPAWKVEAQVDSDVGKPVEYVPKDVAAAIVAGRIAMKLSQKDLATRANMQFRDIQDIESGRAIYNKQKIVVLKRLLKI